MNLSYAVQQSSMHNIPIQFVKDNMGILMKPHNRADERSGCQYRIGRVHTETAAPFVATEARGDQGGSAAGISL